MTAGGDDWSAQITGMSAAWRPPPAGAPEEAVEQLFTGLLDLVSLMVTHDAHLEERFLAYLEAAQHVDRPAWAASARAVWATHLWHLGDEDAATLQVVLAEVDLQKERRRPRKDPQEGPTGPGAAHNNLGVIYSMMRAFELSLPHFRRAVAESQAHYGPQFWLQHLIDFGNVSEAGLRWALHAESIGAVDQARRLAREAVSYARQLEELALSLPRADAVRYARTLIIGATSVDRPESITQDDLRELIAICPAPVFADDETRSVVYAMTARVARILGDQQLCQDAVEKTKEIVLPGDHSMVLVATREAALLAGAQGPVWEYAQASAMHSESIRRRSVTALRARLRLAGLRQRFDAVSAQRAQLQAQLQEAVRHQVALTHAVHHDSLTGLPNRTLFLQRLEAELQWVHDGVKNLALAFVDLDMLKVINDTNGHAAGDTALVTVAEVLRSCVTSLDLAARLSGDEFAVVLMSPGSPADLQQWAQSLNETLSESQFPLTVSVGVCLLRTGSQLPLAQLLAAADEQMYAAKRLGRGRAQVQVLS